MAPGRRGEGEVGGERSEQGGGVRQQPGSTTALRIYGAKRAALANEIGKTASFSGKNRKAIGKRWRIAIRD
jgi:hypothetical protein